MRGHSSASRVGHSTRHGSGQHESCCRCESRLEGGCELTSYVSLHLPIHPGLQVLGPLYLPTPTPAIWREARDTIARLGYGLPGCVGAIDGFVTAIARYRPYDPQAFYNYKIRRPGLNHIAIADASLRFRFVSLGWPGRRHDAGAWKQTTLAKNIADIPLDTLPEPDTDGLPPYFVADAAFPCGPHLLVPFSGAMTEEQHLFCTWLSQTRVIIERAFGVLTGRWRILRRPLEYTPSAASRVVILCVLLHNLCIAERDETYVPPAEEMTEWVQRLQLSHNDAEEHFAEVDDIWDDTSGRALRGRLISLSVRRAVSQAAARTNSR